jgi:hypothetical protein
MEKFSNEKTGLANPLARFAANLQFHRPNASSLSGDFRTFLAREMNPLSPWICCRANNGSSLPGRFASAQEQVFNWPRRFSETPMPVSEIPTYVRGAQVKAV